MSEEDRLGSLCMSIPRHDRRSIAFRHTNKRAYDRNEIILDVADDALDVHPKVKCDLIVATARCVQLSGNGSDAIAQFCFDIEMDIFSVDAKLKRSGADVRPNRFKSGDDGLHVLLGNDMLLGKHAAMGDASSDVFFEELLVERN
jgi:hypothetical protein